MIQLPTRVDLRVDAYETIASETAKHLPRETGGVLLGYQESTTIVVTHALVVHGDGTTTTTYTRDDVLANTLLQEFLGQRADDDPTGYIGEWHSHPSPSRPSSTDHAAMRATAKVSSNPIALLVFTPGGIGNFSGVIANRQRFRRATTKEVTVFPPLTRFEPLSPLPDGAVRGDGPVFISYRQSDGTPQADALEDLLRAAGLVVWRDRTDLLPGTTTDRLEQALTRGLSAGVLVITPDIAYSDIVRERELPRLLQLDADPKFSLCIANTVARAGQDSKCDYGAPDRLLRLSPARTLADKKQSNMLDPSSGEVEIARDLLMHRIEQRKPIIRSEGRDFTLRVQSRPASTALDADEDDLHIRLRPSDEGRLPSRGGLELLQKTLPLTSDAVYAAGAKGVRIEGGAHLSVGLALGSALPETKIGKVVVIDTGGSAWASTALDDDPQSTELTIETTQVNQDATAPKHRVAVFVTLTPHADRTAFERLVNNFVDGFDVAEIISVEGTERIDSREAARLSAEVAQQVKKLSASQGRAEVHLAFHGPYTMAVLIGRYLNTLRTVVYEWDGNKVRPCYQPAIILEPGVTDGPITEVLAS